MKVEVGVAEVGADLTEEVDSDHVEKVEEHGAFAFVDEIEVTFDTVPFEIETIFDMIVIESAHYILLEF